MEKEEEEVVILSTSERQDLVLAWGMQMAEYALQLTTEQLDALKHLPELPNNYYFEKDLNTPTILIREEYPKIYEQIYSDFLHKPDQSGLVVLGQPGIGKTLFLCYALLRALRDKLRVVWAVHPNSDLWIQFGVGKNVRLYRPSSSPRSIYLLDMQPPRFSANRHEGYYVQATSPELSRYKEWSKRLRPLFWVMPNWSIEEIIRETAHRKILTDPAWEGRYLPEEAFKYIGPSARRCFQPTPKSGDPLADFNLRSTIEEMVSVDNLQIIAVLVKKRSARDDGQYPSGFHEVFYVNFQERPLSLYANLSYRPGSRIQQELIAKELIAKRMESDVRVLDIFKACPSIAGLGYEGIIRNTFSAPSSTPTNAIIYLAPDWRTVEVPKPTKSTEFPPSTLDNLQRNTLYCPIVGNFPSLDFLFVTDKNEVVMLQVTVGKKHSTSNKGIHQVIAILRQKNPDVDFSYFFIFVVIYQNNGENLASARRIKMPKNLEKINVGYVVHKVDHGDVDSAIRRWSANQKSVDLPMNKDEGTEDENDISNGDQDEEEDVLMHE